MNLMIRVEKEEDYFKTENLTREAFWDLYKPGCVEHLLIHQLRKSDAFLPELDLVACDDDEIVGNIVYSKAIIKNDKAENAVLCMGPLSVLPSYQNKGIGSLLLRKTIEKAQELGYKAVVTYGNPDYYHKFGFRNAKEYHIQTSEGQNLDAFMVLDLQNDGLSNIYGKFFEDTAFQIDEDALAEFELMFPYKEKHKREGQLE